MVPWLRLTLILLVAGTLLGCHRSNSHSTFSFVNGDEPESLDPAIITGQPEYRLVTALFEGLTSTNAHGETEPGMAESWTRSADGKTIRFMLRNAFWSNGDPITAHDFVISWERALNPLLASKYAELLYPIQNAEAYNKGKIDDFQSVGVHALDSKTLEVQLEYPTPYFLDLCALPTLYPVHFKSLKSEGRNWIKPRHLISNGAYTLKDWRINDRLVFQKNPRYWRAETVHLNEIIALTTGSATTAFNLFYSGKADLVIDKGLVPNQMIQHLMKKDYFHSNPFLGTYFYRFNVTRKPFDNPKVRKAFALSINKKEIVERITRAGEPIANTLTPLGVHQYTPPKGLPQNNLLAQKLLAEAGYPQGKGFPNVSILYNSSELNQQIAVEIQAMWKEVLGVQVTLQNQEWKVYLGSMDKLDFDIVRSSWVGDYNDPYTFLGCFITGNGNNRTGWSNPAYDRLLAESTITADPIRRSEILQDAERILIEEEMPIIPIHFYVGLVLYHPEKLGGFESNVIDVHPLRTLFWKEGNEP